MRRRSKREDIASQSRFTATLRERQRIELSFKVPGTLSLLLQVPGLDGKLRDLHEGDVVVPIPLDRWPISTIPIISGGWRWPAINWPRRRPAARERGHGYRGAGEFRSHESPAGTRVGGPAGIRRHPSPPRIDRCRVGRRAARYRRPRTAVQQAEDDRKHCLLQLPIAKATVSRKYVESGERVQAGQPVFQVMDLATLRAAFGVPDTKVNQFSLGQTMTVMTDAFPGERFAGRVSKILPAADLRTRSFEVELTIDHPKRPASGHGRHADLRPAGEPDPAAHDGRRTRRQRPRKRPFSRLSRKTAARWPVAAASNWAVCTTIAFV